MSRYRDSQNNFTFASVSEFAKMIFEKSIKTSPHPCLVLFSFYNYDNICKRLKSKIHF